VPGGTTYVYIDKSSIQDKWGNKNIKISEKVIIQVDEIAPKMVGALEITAQDSIEITFDQDISENGNNFEVILYSDGDVVDLKAYATATDEVLEITFEEDLFGTYALDLIGVEDENENQASDLHLYMTVVDETAPLVEDFDALLYDGTTQLIRIDFNEVMDVETIGDKAYYFYGNVSLDDDEVEIKVIDDNRGIELEIPSDFINVVEGHDIVIGRVSDASGNLINAIYGELELVDGDDVKLEIKSVELIDENTVILTLLNDVLASIDEDKFSFNSDLAIGKAYPGINDDSESIITFNLVEDVESGDTIKLTVSSGAGVNVYGQMLETGIFTVKDIAAPIVQEVDYVSTTKIIIEFNEPLDTDTFSVAGHNGFSVSGGTAELTSVNYSSSKVTIYGTGFTTDTNVYYNSLFGITDTDGNSLEEFSRTSKLD
jgi:DNA-binding cell septation regulator SpoVG